VSVMELRSITTITPVQYNSGHQLGGGGLLSKRKKNRSRTGKDSEWLRLLEGSLPVSLGLTAPASATSQRKIRSPLLTGILCFKKVPTSPNAFQAFKRQSLLLLLLICFTKTKRNWQWSFTETFCFVIMVCVLYTFQGFKIELGCHLVLPI